MVITITISIIIVVISFIDINSHASIAQYVSATESIGWLVGCNNLIDDKHIFMWRMTRVTYILIYRLYISKIDETVINDTTS